MAGGATRHAPPLNISFTVIRKDEMEQAAITALVKQKMAELHRTQLNMKQREATAVARKSSWAVSVVFLALVWVWQVLGLKQVCTEVDAKVSEAAGLLSGTHAVLAKAKQVWRGKLTPLDDQVLAFEKDRAADAKKLQKLSSALRGSLVAVNLWRWEGDATHTAKRAVVVIPDGAKVRADADPMSTELSKVPAGTVVSIDRSAGRRVRLFSPNPGWISTHTKAGQPIIHFIDPDPDTSPPPP